MPQNRSDLSHLHQRQRLLQILIFSLITIMIWISFSLIRSQKKTSISAELTKFAEPLTPSINTEVIEKLEQKRQFSASELQSFPIYKVLVSDDGTNRAVVTIDTADDALNPSPSPSPVTSPSATLQSTEVSTASAESETL